MKAATTTTTSSFLPPLIVSVAVLGVVKTICVGIFDDAPVKNNVLELYRKYIRPEPSLWRDSYDTLVALSMWIPFLWILWCPWPTWVGAGQDCTLRHSRMVMLYIAMAALAYTTIAMIPHMDLMFWEQIQEDPFLLAKRPSLLLGMVGMIMVEKYGSAPTDWPGHVTHCLLALNVLEASLLGFQHKDYAPAIVLLVTVPFTPMFYIDRDRCLLTCSTDYGKGRPFYARCIPRNPFTPTWYFRFYLIGLFGLHFFSDYFTSYGAIVSLTCLLPLLTVELQSFGIPLPANITSRFELYAEAFFLLRVAPLWTNTFYGISMRNTWISYIDSSLSGRFSFWIENVYLRNAILAVVVGVSLLVLRLRDGYESEEEQESQSDSPSSVLKMENVPTYLSCDGPTLTGSTDDGSLSIMDLTQLDGSSMNSPSDYSCLRKGGISNSCDEHQDTHSL